MRLNPGLNLFCRSRPWEVLLLKSALNIYNKTSGKHPLPMLKCSFSKVATCFSIFALQIISLVSTSLCHPGSFPPPPAWGKKILPPPLTFPTSGSPGSWFPPPSSEIFLALLLSKFKNKFLTFWKPTFC